MPRKVGILAWLIVVLVGALVLGLVFSLRLTPRLTAGRRVVNGLKPVFTPARGQGDRVGVNFASDVVNVADPLISAQGTGAAEVPKLVAFVASKTNVSQADVVKILQASFPHTLALLESLPLSSVTAELPPFLDFVAAQLHVTTADVVTLLKTSFPHLYQAVTNLAVVTAGWDNVPGTTGLTRFNGTPVKTAPQVRDYFSGDVVPVVEKHVTDFHRVATYFPPVNDLPPLLLVIGGIAVLYGLLMMLRAATGKVGHKEGVVSWTIVLLLGLLVLGLVFGAQVYPRLDGGSHLLRDARPAFAPARVAGARAGVNFVSDVVNMADPIMDDQGGAAGDIKTLLTTLSGKLKVTEPQLLAAVTSKFPHVAALLQAVPLSAVNAEIPKVLELLHVALNAPADQVLAALKANVPGLAQSIINLPLVVNGWRNHPGGAHLTRFDGKSVVSAPDLRDYFSADVVGSVEKVAPDFRKLDGIAPDLTLFPGLLTILGILVVVYGIIMLMVVTVPDTEEGLSAIRGRGAGRRSIGVAT